MHSPTMQRMVNNMGIVNEAMHELLVRMIAENPDLRNKKVSENHIKKLKSAVIFNTLIKNDMIIGYTNQQVYNCYCEIAKTISVPILSKIDFSRTLCKYYGFTIIDIHSRKDGLKYRVYVKSKSDFMKNRKLQSFVEFMVDKTQMDIVGKTNTELYQEYLDFFKTYDDKSFKRWKKAISSVEFSRKICNAFGVTIKRTTRNKEACRVYCLKEGVNHGDDSPGQESLG